MRTESPEKTSAFPVAHSWWVEMPELEPRAATSLANVVAHSVCWFLLENTQKGAGKCRWDSGFGKTCEPK